LVDIHAAVKIGCVKKGTSITAIASDMGVNRKTLYSAITGNPSIKTIERISRSLDVPLSTLIKWGEE